MAVTRRAKKKAAPAKGPKTQATTASVPAFLAKAAAGPRLAEAKALVAMMQRATGQKAVMWGDAIVGCDTYTVRYADGREAPWPLVSFSPRKSAFVLYMGWKRHPDLLKAIGKHKTAGGCLHIKSLADVDEAALERLMAAAAKSKKASE
ncbi:MAG TPA: DUF1801 domain-containing protein [Vicinamibacterales bacterium]|nr:DUF1801 domain-containing protein [Vicinamibacterales bacterium]